MDEIMVSICCLAYNHEKYIRRALDGFLNQKTNFKFEVLIHDDASTDGTADIIREYERKYPDIIKPIYQTENQYQKKIKVNWIYQYPRAKGKYIALCEGDDYWVCDTKLQEQVDIMENYPNVMLCTTRVGTVTESESDMGITYPSIDSGIKNGILKSNEFMKLLLGPDKYLFQTSSYLFKADFIKTLTADPPEYMQLSPTGDVALMWSCANNGDVYFIDKECSKYRRGVATSWSARNKNKDFVINHHKRLISAYKAFDKYTNLKYHNLINKNIHTMEISLMNLTGSASSAKDRIKIVVYKIKPVVYRILKKYFNPVLKAFLRRH